MVDLLVDEEARQEDNTTGLCMEYFLKNCILQYLVTIVEKADYPVGIRGEAIRTVASMIDLLDDRFLVHNAVHRPTIKLLRFCVLDDRQSELYSDDLVDLMYIICSKIHGFPALLNIFFHDKQWLMTPQKNAADNDIAQEQSQHEYEFLLFTYLLRFVHREGRSGDFARTGLLFLMELANDQLGDFILGSDFATIMAAGLGALYSQLPRKLIVRDEVEQIYSNPISYLLGQESLENSCDSFGLGAEYSNSHEFKYQLDSFLKLLEFCQDVLTRCPNSNICLSLLKSTRSIFLENILYPSILECSDTDGSSVAVISYVDLILQTVQQEDLSRVIVGYLMNEEEETTSKIDIDLSRMDLNENNDTSTATNDTTTTTANKHLPHFTLKDLIFSRLKSNSQTTVIATLKLLKTLITNHCRYSLGLLSTCPDNNQHVTIISHHLHEVELYFSLISAIDKTRAKDIIDHGYEEYLRDVEMMIDTDECYQDVKSIHNAKDNTYGLQTPKAKRRRSFKYGQRFEDKKEETQQNIKEQTCNTTIMKRHRISSTDPLLQILLMLFSHFFTQSTELNLALTGVISALALCPYRSLEGWMTFSESDCTNLDDVLVLDPNPNSNDDQADKIDPQDIYGQHNDGDTNLPVNDDDDDDDRSIDFGIEQRSDRKTLPTYFKSYPPLFTLLRTLTQQVDYYRSEIHVFDMLLEERRHALIAGETSFLDKRSVPMSPSNSLTTAIRNSRLMNSHGPDKRPSLFRPSTPLLSPSSSTSSTVMGTNNSRISSIPPPIPNINMNTILNNSTSPLTVHIRKTANKRIQPLFPSNFTNEKEDPILDLDDEDEHTFAPKALDPSSQSRRADKSTEITLSMLLNNVVILEEAIKELIALIQVRRSLGIDEILYV
ncbi:MAG: Retinoic acid induced 16-like protein-domain-containing protein [Benjaminiella poitrasii]|nr:MAG: Retinoic acid induced 16-like protein-domain-containing protein [Benjaminiella poitrasii]